MEDPRIKELKYEVFNLEKRNKEMRRIIDNLKRDKSYKTDEFMIILLEISYQTQGILNSVYAYTQQKIAWLKHGGKPPE